MSSQLNREIEKTETKESTLFDLTFRDSEGKIVIAQKPNLPLLVGLAAISLKVWLPSDQIQTVFTLIGYGALFTWAWQELFDGVNYFRRALGLIGLAIAISLGLQFISL